MAELEIVLLQGDIGRDTHDEHEEREDEIGGGEAIPLSVAQGAYICPQVPGLFTIIMPAMVTPRRMSRARMRLFVLV